MAEVTLMYVHKFLHNLSYVSVIMDTLQHILG